MSGGEDPDVLCLNVGGVYFATRRATLLASDSFFSGLVRSHPERTDFFIDRDPTHFRHVLNWIRGVRFLPEDATVLAELTWEADFYSLDDMRLAISHAHAVSVPRTLAAIHAELRQAA
jgi:hypothetical protein